MTLQFETPDKLYEIEREPVEALLQEGIHQLLTQQNLIDRATLSMINGLLDMFLLRVDIKPPKGANRLEFLAAYILKQSLDALEGTPIPVDVKEVAKHEKEVDPV